jgi:hypothetical protein
MAAVIRAVYYITADPVLAHLGTIIPAGWVVSVPAVPLPAAMATPVVDGPGLRGRPVDGGGTGADEGGVAGVVAMGEGPQGECRKGQRYG